MPIHLKRKNGEVTPYKNSEFIPAYYFIPKEAITKLPHELRELPRNPWFIFRDWDAIAVVESDLFLQLMIDGFAQFAWPYMGMGPDMEIYSGYDPVYLTAHMNDLGYEFCRDANGNNPSIIAKGWKRPVRLKSLGAKYDPEEMKEKIISNQLKKELFVYDDKLVLTYNYKDGTETLTLQEIESVLSSNLTSMCPPEQRTDLWVCSFVLRA